MTMELPFTTENKQILSRSPRCRPNPKVRTIQWDKMPSPHHRKLLEEFLTEVKNGEYVTVKVHKKLAEAILVGLNWRNPRTLSMSYARQLAVQMRKKNWIRSPAPLYTNDTKEWLMDGQHRIAAVELSGISQYFVFCPVKDEVASATDTGRKRSLAVLTGLPAKRASLSRTLVELLNCREAVPGCQILDIDNAFSDHIDFVLGITQFKKKRYGAAILATFVFGLAQTEDNDKEHEQIVDFINGMALGTELKPTDPVYIAREWLEDNKFGNHVVILGIFHRLCYAMHCAIQGKQIQRLMESEKAVAWFSEKNLKNIAIIKG